MNILLTGNCQVDGLHYFLSRALPHFEFRRLPHLATFYGEFSEEKIAEDHAWADLVFFHHKHDHPQDYPTKQPKIPLSVWFQSAPFMAQIPDELWAPVIERAKHYGVDSAVEYAVKEHDFEYEERWDNCLARMKEKEENEKVPGMLRMSEYMNIWGRDRKLQLTCNHPTSYVFWEWTLRIVNYLGENINPMFAMWSDVERNSNLAGLPCEESATSGARKHLGLQWGGRPEDNDSGRAIARERLSRLMSQ